MPLSATLCGLPLALSKTERVPVLVPATTGLKVTEIVQLTPALREVPQVLVWEKSPTVPMLEMASGAPPLLVSVTVCALLLVPTISAGKGSEVVDKLTTGAAGSAVTDSATSGAALKFELPA